MYSSLFIHSERERNFLDMQAAMACMRFLFLICLRDSKRSSVRQIIKHDG